MQDFTISGNIVDVFNQKIYYGSITISEGKIVGITSLQNEPKEAENFIMPGFIDSHVHIESSMLIPAEFAKLAVAHGTIGTISDPHEIANVCGIKGVQFMIENGKTVPFKFNFGAPSCVPATIFETAGAALNANEVDLLLQSDDVLYLSEMMNFPGVLNGDDEVMKKIAAAKKYNKPVDGHAPGLRGELAKRYIDAGISTDHECFTKEEAQDKLNFGMKILIREGSAAKNFEALIDLLNDHPDEIMFCSDDKHPDSLLEGHINLLCQRAAAKGINLFHIIKAACINPVLHYKMYVGLLRSGDWADFIVVEDLVQFKTQKTFINGELVWHIESSTINPRYISAPLVNPINNFKCNKKTITDFIIPFQNEQTIPVIEALEGQLITNKLTSKPKVHQNTIISDVENDVLKMVVVNRYSNTTVAKSFVKNFGIQQGAIASSVAHDSHNIIAVGADDESILKAVNLVIQSQGGISAVLNDKALTLGLPVAGLMSADDGYKVAHAYTAIDKMAKVALGSTLAAPFMTLSFMALLVIPHLKLSDLGLFDGDQFKLIRVC